MRSSWSRPKYHQYGNRYQTSFQHPFEIATWHAELMAGLDKPASRASMAPSKGSPPARRPSAPKATVSTTRVLARSAVIASNGSRQSAAGRPSALAGRTSRAGRATAASSTSMVVSRPLQNGNDPSKDPRKLRDRNRHQKLIQDLYDFLRRHRYREVANMALSLQLLRAPTKRDFISIFKFIYNLLDPNHPWGTKSIENEIFQLLKLLRYPYLDSINRSQLSGVGGQSWPLFLGMLTWLTELVSVTSRWLHNFETREEEFLGNLFYKYMASSYNAYLTRNEDDFTDQLQTLESRYESFQEGMAQEIRAIERATRNVQEQNVDLARAKAYSQELRQRHEALQDDVQKMQQFVEDVLRRQVKWSNTLNKLRDEKQSLQKRYEQVRAEDESLSAEMKEHGITLSEVEKVRSEREHLHKQKAALEQQLVKATESIRELEQIADDKYSELEAQREIYYRGLESLELPCDDYYGNITFEVKLDRPLAPENLGKDVHALLPKVSFTNEIEPSIALYEKTMRDQIQSLDGIIQNTQDETAALSLKCAQLTAEIESERSRNNLAESAQSREVQVVQQKLSDTRQQQSLLVKKVDEFSAKVAELQASAGSNSLEAIHEAHAEKRREIAARRAQACADLQLYASNIVDFKLYIQNTLEQLDEAVVAELQS